jgi:C-terminal processing protease CtpA/Prc
MTAAFHTEETFDYTKVTDSTILLEFSGFSDGEIEYNDIGNPMLQWDRTYDSLKKYISVVDPFPIVIVDVRGNHGGNIVVMELIIASFLPEGRAYIRARERDYDKESRTAQTLDHTWSAKKDTAGVDLVRSHLDGKKVTVLIDGESASASEVLAAGFKDGIGATLVGRRTYGKGIGQILLPRRKRASLKITYVQFRGISEEVGAYHSQGIRPDVQVDNGNSASMLLAAVRVHEPSVTSIQPLHKKTHPSSPYAAFKVADEELLLY